MMPVDPVAAAKWFVESLGCTAFPVWGAREGRCNCGDPHDGTGKHGPENVGKHPATVHGFQDATGDVARIRKFLSNPGTPNYGLNAPPGVLVIDVDGDGLQTWEGLQHRYGPLPVTLTTTTANGRHYWFRWPEDAGPMPTGKLFGFVVRRHDDGYVIGPGSVHPTGVQYDTLRTDGGKPYAIAELPRAWAEAVSAPVTGVRTLTIDPGSYQLPEPGYDGARYDEILRYVASRYIRGLDKEEVWAGVTGVLAPRFRHQLTEPELRSRFERTWENTEKRLGPPRQFRQDAESGGFRMEPPEDAGPSLIEYRGVEFPPPPQPVVYEGLIGEFVEALSQDTDASAVGLLAVSLAWLGGLIPATTYFGSGSQTSSPYLALVGVSAQARKGTAMTRVKDGLADVFAIDTVNKVRLAGIASGEGLIMALSNRQKDDRDPHAIGVMAEAEFASVLAASSREGSTLDAKLREAFDGEQLWHTRVSGILTVKQPYWLPAIIAVTPAELQDKLPKGALLNGSGNRWLYVPVERRDVRAAGHVRPDIPLELRKAFIAARQVTREQPVHIPTEAEAAGRLVDYERLLYANTVGLQADLTRRYSTIALRIALIHAAAERSRTVGSGHVARAIALTEYARSGLRFAFGDAFAGDEQASVLLDHLRAHGGVLTAQYISRFLVRDAVKRDRAVRELQRLRLATVRQVPTKGRPRTELMLETGREGLSTTFAHLFRLPHKDQNDEEADLSVEKVRESRAEGARKVRESRAEVAESHAWLRLCRQYEEHRDSHRNTPLGWVCRACDEEE